MRLNSADDIKQFILDKYKCRIELHAHTSPISGCADLSPEETIKKYAGLGFGAVVITNHFIYAERTKRFESEPTAEQFVKWYMQDFYDAKAVGDKLGINVILGAEIRFSENSNDYLVYGVDEKKLEVIFDSLADGIAEFKKNEYLKDVLIIQAHPFRNGMEKVDVSYIDGIEAFNMHTGHNSRIADAVRYAKDNGINIKTIGSDFHHNGGEGIGLIRTKFVPNNSFELAKILRKGDYVFEIADNSVVLP